MYSKIEKKEANLILKKIAKYKKSAIFILYLYKKARVI